MQHILAKLRHSIEEKELSIKHLILRSDIDLKKTENKLKSQAQADPLVVKEAEDDHDAAVTSVNIINKCGNNDIANDVEKNKKELTQQKQLKIQILFENAILQHFEITQEIKELQNETSTIREEIYELVCIYICASVGIQWFD